MGYGKVFMFFFPNFFLVISFENLWSSNKHKMFKLAIEGDFKEIGDVK